MSFKRICARSFAISSRFYDSVYTNSVCSCHGSKKQLHIYPRSVAKLSTNSVDHASSLSSWEDLYQRRFLRQNKGFLNALWTPHRSNHRLYTSDGLERPGKSSYEAEQVTESSQSSELVTDIEVTERPKGVLTIDELVEVLRGENARDICVIKVPVSLKYVDYLVIVSGSSTRHLKAMSQYIIKLHKNHKAAKDKFVTVEGEDCDDWMAIDLGNIALHMMLPEVREKYELEKLWTLGSEYDDQSRAINFLDFPFSLSDQFEILHTED